MTAVIPRDDMSPSVHVEAGQRWTSNAGGPDLTVLQKSNDGDDKWLVKAEDDGVMMTIDEWRLVDDYELHPR